MKKKKQVTDDWAWFAAPKVQIKQDLEGGWEKVSPPVEQEAREIVDGKRQEDYGTPQLNHLRTATLWSAYSLAASYGGTAPSKEEEVCWKNILQKISREMHSPTRDGLTDIIGYTINIAKLRGYE